MVQLKEPSDGISSVVKTIVQPSTGSTLVVAPAGESAGLRSGSDGDGGFIAQGSERVVGSTVGVADARLD